MKKQIIAAMTVAAFTTITPAKTFIADGGWSDYVDYGSVLFETQTDSSFSARLIRERAEEATDHWPISYVTGALSNGNFKNLGQVIVKYTVKSISSGYDGVAVYLAKASVGGEVIPWGDNYGAFRAVLTSGVEAKGTTVVDTISLSDFYLDWGFKASGYTYTASGSDTICTLDNNLQALTDLNSLAFTIERDNTLGADTMDLTVHTIGLNFPNSTPTLSSATMQTIGKNAPFTITPSMTDASDPDGDPLTVLTFPGTGYTISGSTITPNAGYTGSLIVPIMVTDGKATSQQVNMVVVVDPNVAVVPQTNAVTAFTASLSGRTIQFSRNLPAGSTVALFDLSGRQVISSEVTGSSFAIGEITRGVYIAEICAGGKSVVQKVTIE